MVKLYESMGGPLSILCNGVLGGEPDDRRAAADVPSSDPRMCCLRAISFLAMDLEIVSRLEGAGLQC